jgi:tRNA modification GTPase
VFNKVDLSAAIPGASNSEYGRQIRVSAVTGAGLDVLRKEMLAALGWQGDEEGTFLARTRHLDALRRAATHLAQAWARSQDLELLAEELRLAQRALGEITGEVTADDLLGEIFAHFCIGK